MVISRVRRRVREIEVRIEGPRRFAAKSGMQHTSRSCMPAARKIPSVLLYPLGRPAPGGMLFGQSYRLAGLPVQVSSSIPRETSERGRQRLRCEATKKSGRSRYSPGAASGLCWSLQAGQSTFFSPQERRGIGTSLLGAKKVERYPRSDWTIRSGDVLSINTCRSAKPEAATARRIACQVGA